MGGKFIILLSCGGGDGGGGGGGDGVVVVVVVVVVAVAVVVKVVVKVDGDVCSIHGYERDASLFGGCRKSIYGYLRGNMSTRAPQKNHPKPTAPITDQRIFELINGPAKFLRRNDIENITSLINRAFHQEDIADARVDRVRHAETGRLLGTTTLHHYAGTH